MRMVQPADRRRAAAGRAFTLVELLVVVAIIMLLIAIIAPSLGNTREAARKTLCHNNLHQIHQAFSGFNSHPAGMRGYAIPGVEGWLGYTEAFGAGASLLCPSDGSASHGTSSILQWLPEAPPSIEFVLPNSPFESSNLVFIFREREAFQLPAAVSVDITQPGFYTNMRSGNGTPGSIPAGTYVDSYFLHYDAVGNASSTTAGSVPMGGKIKGIICLDDNLDASDPILGLPTVKYSTGRANRGFENREQITVAEDMSSFIVDEFHATYPGEDVRVITDPGGNASYGMNNQVPSKRMPRSGQALLVEYEKSIVNLDFQDDNNDDLDEWLAPRHFGRANVMFSNGGVQAMDPEDLEPEYRIWKEDPQDGTDPPTP